MAAAPKAPDGDCRLCPRLAGFRDGNRVLHQSRFPDQSWHDAPVGSFGDIEAELLIVGLAPGMGGANRTGRPFTGDYAGDLLYATLGEVGLAKGHYRARPDDGLTLVNCRITNAVKCVPPENKPTPAEINTCRPFLADEMAAMPNLRRILALGLIAHSAVLAAFGLRKSHCRFAHGAQHALPNGIVLADSYHCSRYNTNTGRLTPEMFHAVLSRIASDLNRN